MVSKFIIPKIVFRQSWLYDEALRRKQGSVAPSKTTFKKKLDQLEKIWANHGPKTLLEITRLTKLKWQEQEIVCYLTYGVAPFSDPLTTVLRKDTTYMFDEIVHELIHRLLLGYEKSPVFIRNYERLMKRWGNEPINTRIHNPVHAIHMHVFKKLFGERRLNREINFMRKYKDYARSWQIVKEEGYKNIIADLTRGLR